MNMQTASFQLFDPHTYMPLMERPTLGNFKTSVRDGVLSGKISVPSNRILDSRAFIEEEALQQYRAAFDLYVQARRAGQAQLRLDAEKEYMPSEWSQKLRDKCHELAEDSCYADAVALIESILEIGG